MSVITDSFRNASATLFLNSRRVPSKKSVLTIFGTRPEVIKLAPVLLQLERKTGSIRTINVSSGQHAELLHPLIEVFGIRVDFDLRLMTENQNLETLRRRIVQALSQIIRREAPDLIIVQGDTTTALAGAIAGHRQDVPVAHVEAGLRSGDLFSPYPEEMNRRWITKLASYHFAPTQRNRDSLLREGISETAAFVTGNPVVDALQMVLLATPSPCLAELLAKIGNRKCIMLTAHRRESFGPVLRRYLEAIRTFVEKHADVVVVFPVHPNPAVKRLAYEILDGDPRVILTTPLPYAEFINLLSKSWLIVSDSGGIQEEVASLGRPLLILRENTERSECIETGVARLVGGRPESLQAMLEEAHQPDSWVNGVKKTLNPFGKGNSADLIVNRISFLLERQIETAAPQRHANS